MSEQEILSLISKKLSVLIALQLRSEGDGAVQEHVLVLNRLGLTTPEIAEILGTTPGTVSVAKNRLKHRKHK